MMCPCWLQVSFDELMFETFGFGATYRSIPASFALSELDSTPLCASGTGIIIDSGFSFTHAIPFHQFRVVTEGVRRVDVGGKLLTNHLKELISYRQWNMMDDTYVVNKVRNDSERHSSHAVQVHATVAVSAGERRACLCVTNL